MLRLPLETELAAAISAAATAGLCSVAPELLHLGNHTTVRLSPLPIVARIASGTSFDFSHESLAREIAIARHLAAEEAPSVRPAPAMFPGPYLENDCAVTLWEFVDGRAVDTGAEEAMAAASLQRLHAALATFDADLPSFITKVESCETILGNPIEAPRLGKDDRLFLERAYRKLREQLNGVRSVWQPLHGDAHLGNVLINGSGAIWMDLESACSGPLEWDVVSLPMATWPAFNGIDADLMRLLAEVRSLCVAVWCWAEFDRSEAAAEAAVHHLGKLKQALK
jgi:Phosphotransferase enzyme family